jgi:hypothetical protein
MAQTGFTPIQLYSTSTAAAAPVAGNLTNSTLGSELAINITDGKLFYKDNANAVQVIGWKTVPTTAGGTGLTTYTAGDLSYYATGTTFTKLAIGTVGQILTSTGSAPQWTTLSGVAVTTFSAGTTGFTPNSATSGAITLAGTLATTNGGTGLTAFTANGVFYASSTSVIGQSANLTFNGTTLTSGGYSTVGNLTFTGTGNRITGEFSSGTLANNVAFQSSTTNGATLIQAIPNGTGTSSQHRVYNNSDVNNSAFGQFFVNTSEVRLFSGFTGTGTALPLTLHTNNAERLRIFTSGGVSIGNTTDPGATNLSVTGAVILDNNQSLRFKDAGGTVRATIILNTSDELNIQNNTGGDGGPILFNTKTGGGESARITADGEMFIAGTVDQGAYNLQCNGTGVWGAGAYVNGSDARIKDDIAPLDSGLDVVAKLNPVTYKYKETWSKDQSTQTGFIAQELLTALGGEVYVDGVVQQGGEYMSVAYQNIIPILTKAIQELNDKVISLEEKLKSSN